MALSAVGPEELLVLKLMTLAGLTAALMITASQAAEEFQWLEEVDGPEAIAWVDAANAETAARLGSSALYETLYQEALSVLSNPGKLPVIEQKGQHVYNLWQDAAHPRGLYRRTLTADFAHGEPRWETVIDLDELSAEEKRQWVLKDLDCLSPEYRRCLMSLSDGGGDTIEVREFDSVTLQFVSPGFALPAAKSRVGWIDENQLYVGTNFGEGTMTDSGYPRQVRRWQRGTELANAELLYTSDVLSVGSNGHHYDDGRNTLDLVTDAVTYWEYRYLLVQGDTVAALDLPASSVVEDFVDGQLLISLQSDWSYQGKVFPEGAVVLVKPPLPGASNEIPVSDITILIEPSHDFIVEEVHASAKGIVVIGLVDVEAQARLYRKQDGGLWQWQALALPDTGSISIETIDFTTGHFFARYQDFLTPPSLYYIGDDLIPVLAESQPATFDSTGLKAEQYFATSTDGTKVPYFVVMRANTPLDGRNPAQMFSYGGFRVSLKPSYSGSYEDLNGVYGKLWLERGGVFVLANIRGGGEYGPAWHKGALGPDHVRAFEDFEAVARDLFARNITSPKHLGIEGRSNGGLLVGATMVRHPELYGAVICGVPLADMQRYSHLGAGASWMAEYGNPEIAEEWAWMEPWSPYQNLSAEADYPPVFFFTSTRDDRVHPGHARKMAARMMEQGHTVEYYENREGGHGGSSTPEQLARRVALAYTLLWNNLGDEGG